MSGVRWFVNGEEVEGGEPEAMARGRELATLGARTIVWFREKSWSFLFVGWDNGEQFYSFVDGWA